MLPSYDTDSVNACLSCLFLLSDTLLNNLAKPEYFLYWILKVQNSCLEQSAFAAAAGRSLGTKSMYLLPDLLWVLFTCVEGPLDETKPLPMASSILKLFV